MRLKKGVRIHGARPEIIIGMMVADSIYKEYGQELVITAIADGKHVERSDHYDGAGFDCRTRYFGEDEKESAQWALQAALGQDFIVILESTHIHISWRPKRLS